MTVTQYRYVGIAFDGPLRGKTLRSDTGVINAAIAKPEPDIHQALQDEPPLCPRFEYATYFLWKRVGSNDEIHYEWWQSAPFFHRGDSPMAPVGDDYYNRRSTAAWRSDILVRNSESLDRGRQAVLEMLGLAGEDHIGFNSAGNPVDEQGREFVVNPTALDARLTVADLRRYELAMNRTIQSRVQRQATSPDSMVVEFDLERTKLCYRKVSGLECGKATVEGHDLCEEHVQAVRDRYKVEKPKRKYF